MAADRDMLERLRALHKGRIAAPIIHSLAAQPLKDVPAMDRAAKICDNRMHAVDQVYDALDIGMHLAPHQFVWGTILRAIALELTGGRHGPQQPEG